MVRDYLSNNLIKKIAFWPNKIGLREIKGKTKIRFVASTLWELSCSIWFIHELKCLTSSSGYQRDITMYSYVCDLYHKLDHCSWLDYGFSGSWSNHGFGALWLYYNFGGSWSNCSSTGLWLDHN